MAITAERLRVEVEADTTKAKDDLEDLEDTGSRVPSWVGAAKAAMVGFAAAGAAAFAGQVISAASDLNETVSKTGQVFGDSTGDVTGYAQKMADDFGIPKTAILDAASSFGLLGNAAGMAQDQSAGMATALSGLAADASSFYNVPLEEALAAIQSGLVGEAEPMRKFGVLLNEAAVQQEALRLGIWDGTSAMTEAQKVQARSSLIMAGMTTASGDLARTQDSVSNRTRELAGRVQNLAADFGQRLLPVVASVLGGFIDLIGGIQPAVQWISEHRKALAIAAGVVTAVFLPAMISAGVTATISAAQIVAAWVAQQAAAIAGAAAQWAALARIVAGWVAAGAAAIASGAQTVAIWAMYKAQAIQGAATFLASQARIVAGWVVMGFQSMLQAAKMAAAWVLAMGPVGWIIAAVVALVALIIANWDTISRVTAQVWGAIVGWVKGAWETIVGWVTSAVETVRGVIERVFGVIKAIVMAYVNAWRFIIETAWSAILAVVRFVVNAVVAYINGWRAIGAQVREFFDNARQGIADTLNRAVDFVRGIPARIVDALGNVGALLRESGRKIIQGLVDGIRGAISKVTDAVGDVMRAARDFLPFSPAKRGPFSGKGWSGYSGQSISADLAAGMARNRNLVAKAAQDVARAAALNLPGATLGGVSGGSGVPGTPRAFEAATGALGLASQAAAAGPSTLVVVDADGELIATMRVQAGKVATGQITPLDEGRPAW